MYIRPFDFQLQLNASGILMFKVDNKNTGPRYETCLKLKLKNKYTRTTLSNGSYLVLVFLLLTLKMFKVNNRNSITRYEICSCFTLYSSVSSVIFGHVIAGWEVIINSSEILTRTRLFLQ